METRQQDLYSSVLSGAVVDWEGPGDEWVNTNGDGEEQVCQHPEGPRDQDLAHLSEERHGVGRSLGDHRAPGCSQNGGAGRAAGDSAAWPGGSCGARSPAAGQEEWGRPSLCLSEDWPMTSTWDMNTPGLLDSEPLREADEDLANLNYPILTEEERQEIHQELVKLEEEISTLKQVLTSKEKQHADLRLKLGISPLSDFKNNVSRGWQDMQTSVAYKKTSETFSTAGQKTSAAFSTLGTAITRKLGDMRSNSIGYSIQHSMSMPTMRNSPSFKSFEEKVESTVTNIKTKVGGTEPGGSFEEVLSSAAQASSQDRPTHHLTDTSERPC